MRLIVRPDAERDIDDAFLWYESRRTGLGLRFLLSVETALAAIERNPFTYQVIHATMRRALTARFPYAVFFVVDEDEVRVIAVMHAKRSPRAWRKRLRE